MIHAASRQSLAQLRTRLISVLPALASAEGAAADGGPGHGGPADSAAADLLTFARELYAVADLLGDQPRLRRALADSSTDASSRAELARSLLRARISEVALDVVAMVVELRWSSPWDLADSLEISADDALLSAAEQQGVLDAVEDELFRFERILADSGELVAALDEVSVPVDRRTRLLASVLAGKTNAITSELLAHAVGSGRKRSLELAIDDLLEASAERRERSVARVIAASELTDAQTVRLGTVLTRMYGRTINVRSAVDTNVRGGLMVRVGGEVIDGTVATKLAAARAALVG